MADFFNNMGALLLLPIGAWVVGYALSHPTDCKTKWVEQPATAFGPALTLPETVSCTNVFGAPAVYDDELALIIATVLAIVCLGIAALFRGGSGGTA